LTNETGQAHTLAVRALILCLLAAAVFPSLSRAQAPVFVIAPEGSWIKFHVKASAALAGEFDTRDASLTFTSPEETTGALAITIQAESVDTGSNMQNGKRKSKDFFDVQQNPLITFGSTKIAPHGPETFEVVPRHEHLGSCAQLRSSVSCHFPKTCLDCDSGHRQGSAFRAHAKKCGFLRRSKPRERFPFAPIRGL
jgi:YceI-like domain